MVGSTCFISQKRKKVMKKLILVSLFLIPFNALSDVQSELDVVDAVPVTETDVVDYDVLVSDVVDSDVVSDTSNSSDTPNDVSSDDALDVVSDTGVNNLTPEKDSITQDDINLIVQAVKEENWMLLVGLILTFLVLILDKWINIKQWVGEKGLPWVAASLGIVSHIGIALATGTGWVTAIITGVLSGATAVGLWNLLSKKK
jgi:hypothetical protein